MPAKKSNLYTRERIDFGHTEIKMAHEITTIEKSVSDFNKQFGTNINVFGLMLYPPTPNYFDLANEPPIDSAPLALPSAQAAYLPRPTNSTDQPQRQKRTRKPSQKAIENSQAATTSPKATTNEGGLMVPRNRNETSARVTKHYATPERHTQRIGANAVRSSTMDLKVTKPHKRGPTKLKITCRAWRLHQKIQKLNAEIQYLAALFDGTFHFSTPQARITYASRQHLSPTQRQNLEKCCCHIIKDVRDNQSYFSMESEVSHEENRRIDGIMEKDLEARHEAVKAQIEGGIVEAGGGVLMQMMLHADEEVRTGKVSTWIDESVGVQEDDNSSVSSARTVIRPIDECV